VARVLVLAGYFAPGFRAGGPIRSLSRLVESEASSHDVTVVTRDRDFGTTERFEIADRSPVSMFGARVEYVDSTSFRGRSDIVGSAVRRPYDLVYLSSLFSPCFSVAPLTSLLAKRRGPAILLAPRGECGRAALAIKSRKKAIASAVLRPLTRSRRVVWHSTTPMETADIAGWLGRRPAQVVASTAIGATPLAEPSRGGSDPDRLRLISVSRITPIKDIARLVRILQLVRARVRLDLYGPIDDRPYWSSLQPEIARLPEHVIFRYGGVLPADQVAGELSTCDAMVTPTQGENFGHSIAEALAVGCPVVTTRATIWTDLLGEGAGIAIRHDAEAARFIDDLAAAPPAERRRVRRRTWLAYRRWRDRHSSSQSLFTRALEQASSRGVREEQRMRGRMLAGWLVPARWSSPTGSASPS
jgi:glycosyltransferase involved in cell wall biosynthesis